MRKSSAIKAGLAVLGAYAMLGTASIFQNWFIAGGENLSFEQSEIALKEERYYGMHLHVGDPLQPVGLKKWEGYVYKQDDKGRWYLINENRQYPTWFYAFLQATKPARMLAHRLSK